MTFSNAFAAATVKTRVTRSDWWDPNRDGLPCVAAYQGKGAANLEASRVNLANPGTYGLTTVNYDAGNGEPDWTEAKGWYRTQANWQAWSTGITTAHSEWSYVVSVANAIYSYPGGVAFGVAHAGGHNEVVAVMPWYRSPFGSIFYNAEGGWELGTPRTEGVFGIAGRRCFLNGAFLGSILYYTPVDYPYPLYLMCFNDCNQTTIHAPFWGDLLSFSCYSRVLSDVEMAHVSAGHTAIGV